MGESELVYDYAIVGSGFGGSVSALRLTEKGYKVLLLEKGSELKGPDFPETNWDVKRWLWAPFLGARGLFQMRPFRHVQVLAGAGVGGGSLTYANTLPIPKRGFFASPQWAHLADWENELAPHYRTARLRHLGHRQHRRYLILNWRTMTIRSGRAPASALPRRCGVKASCSLEAARRCCGSRRPWACRRPPACC